VAVVDEKVKKLRFIIGKAEGRGKFFSRFFGERAPALITSLKNPGLEKPALPAKLRAEHRVRLLERLITSFR